MMVKKEKLFGLFLFFLPWFSPLGYLFLIISLIKRAREGNLRGLIGFSLSFFNFSLFFLTGAILVSTILSLDPLLSLGGFILFFFCLMTAFSMREYTLEGRVEYLLNAIFLGAAIVIGFGVIQYFLNLNFKVDFSFFHLDISTRAGISSTLGNPNRLAKYLVLILPFALTTFQYKKGIFRLFLGILLILGLFCLVLTRSLGGIGALGIVFLIFILLKRWKWGIILLGIGFFLFMLKFDFLLSVIDKYSCWENRLYTWENMIWPVFKNYPLFGTGIATYRVALSSYSSKLLVLTSHAHNLYLNYLVEIGIFGLAGLILVFLAFFKNCALAFKEKEPGKNKGLIEGCFLAIVGALIHGSVETYIDYFQLGLIFWGVIGMGIGLYKGVRS